MHKYLSNRQLHKYAALSALYLFGPLFFALTNPENLPLPLLVVPFVWLFVTLFATTWVVLGLRSSTTRRQAVIVAGMVATIPVLLAVFQSIHQLSLRDVLLSVGLVTLAAVYVIRADFIK